MRNQIMKSTDVHPHTPSSNDLLDHLSVIHEPANGTKLEHGEASAKLNAVDKPQARQLEVAEEYDESVGSGTQTPLLDPHSRDLMLHREEQAKPRITEQQHMALECQFQKRRKPNTTIKKQVAVSLELTPLDDVNVTSLSYS